MVVRGKWTSLIALVYGVAALVVSIVVAKPSSALMIGLVAPVVVVAAGMYYFDIYRPTQIAVAANMAALQKQMPFFLGLMCSYMMSNFAIPQLRCNIMLARQNIVFHWKPLKIDFYANNYGKAELEQSYRYNAGCCGTALAEKGPIYFDSAQSQEPYKGMSATQRTVTNHLKSILSIPIFAPGEVGSTTTIAILNFDSELDINSTHFDKLDVQESAMKIAGLIASLLS